MSADREPTARRRRGATRPTRRVAPSLCKPAHAPGGQMRPQPALLVRALRSATLRRELHGDACGDAEPARLRRRPNSASEDAVVHLCDARRRRGLEPRLGAERCVARRSGRRRFRSACTSAAWRARSIATAPRRRHRRGSRTASMVTAAARPASRCGVRAQGAPWAVGRVCAHATALRELEEGPPPRAPHAQKRPACGAGAVVVELRPRRRRAPAEPRPEAGVASGRRRRIVLPLRETDRISARRESIDKVFAQHLRRPGSREPRCTTSRCAPSAPHRRRVSSLAHRVPCVPPRRPSSSLRKLHASPSRLHGHAAAAALRAASPPLKRRHFDHPPPPRVIHVLPPSWSIAGCAAAASSSSLPSKMQRIVSTSRPSSGPPRPPPPRPSATRPAEGEGGAGASQRACRPEPHAGRSG